MAFSFGAPAQQPQQQQQQPAASGSGFSFGGASTSQQPQQQQQTSGTTGGGFSFGGGQQQQQQQGQQQQQQAASTGGFSFGQPQQQNQQNQQQQQPSSTGGLFGSSTGGGFGASSGGLFGQQSQQQQAKPAFSFGGSTTQQQPQQQQQQPQLGQSQFGQSQLGASQFGQSQNQNQQQQQAQQQQPQQDKKLGLSLAPKMEQLRQAWDTNNLQTCRFMTYFYNSLPPGVLPPSGPSGAGGGGPFEQNPNFGRRQDAVGPHHDALWSSAVASNPSPTTLVPVLAVGYPDLKARIEAQEREAGRQAEHLAQLRERLEKAERRETLQDSVRARAALRRQQAIHSRIMGIARKSHVLVPAATGPGGASAATASLSASRGAGAGGGSITKEEEQLRARLEACEAELEAALTGSAPNSSSSRHPSATATKLKSRINDLWTSLASIKAQREQMERSGRRPGGVEWAVVDQKGVDDVTNILAQQQAGLNHLVQTLEEDARGLETVVRGLRGVKLVGIEGGRRS